MEKNIELPKSWNLTEKQECIIGSLLDAPGSFVSPRALCRALYGEVHTAAPAKLRVAMQRCRDIVWERTNGRVEIETKKGKGWRLTTRNMMILKKAIVKARKA